MAKDIWDIPDSNHTMDITAEERYWISEHSSGYDILSLTDCQSVLDDLLANIESHLSTVSRSKSLDEVKILIPGCGTRVKLEVAIAQNFPGVQIHCGDFTDVIQLATSEFARLKEQLTLQGQSTAPLERVSYHVLDSTNLPDSPKYDLIIVINSVLASQHNQNFQMLESFRRVISPEGRLIGFFPNIFAVADLLSLIRSPDEVFSQIDIQRSSYFEQKQQIEQVFYSPLRLRHLLVSLGFEIERLEVYFFDKPDVFERVRRHYAEFFHPDTDVVFYEHYLEAVPQRKSRGESERASN